MQKRNSFSFKQFSFKSWIACFLIATPLLHSEIHKVSLTWNAGLCLQSCVVGLDKQFRKVNGVTDVTISQQGGRADLKWSPNVVFSFAPINAAMSMIGLYMNELRVQVTGHISHNQQNLFLISEKDGTRFLLKSPLVIQPGKYNEQYSIYAYSVSPQDYQQMIDAENNHKLVTISGPILEPYRSPPLVLIMESKSVSH